MKHLDQDGTLALLKKVLWQLPRLDGAACVGRHALFAERGPDEDDDTVERRHHQALTLCRVCPALTACREFAATEKSSGEVIAGMNRTHTSRTDRTAQEAP
ncbi:WhiB family transcriptional regulator [Gordonia sp. FQ]|uniref:WhiB family transcriptional regulator n=1 Tax=Gordonia sp. FQ TaxID=3446634 RepID=UPI003F849752